jgi:hypothetical protein
MVHLIDGGRKRMNNTRDATPPSGAVATGTNPVVGCPHIWQETVDSQFSNLTHVEVKCVRCGMVGERTVATGEVFFPAT